MTDLYLSTTHFGIQNKIKCVRNDMGEESSPEVTSSCGRLSSSDFREVDLELWDLDVNQQRTQLLHGHGGVVVRSMKTFSETSSMSGKAFAFLFFGLVSFFFFVAIGKGKKKKKSGPCWKESIAAGTRVNRPAFFVPICPSLEQDLETQG